MARLLQISLFDYVSSSPAGHLGNEYLTWQERIYDGSKPHAFPPAHKEQCTGLCKSQSDGSEERCFESSKCINKVLAVVKMHIDLMKEH